MVGWPEDIEIGDDPVLVDRLWNDDQPFLMVPSDDHLRHGLAVLSGDVWLSPLSVSEFLLSR